MDFVLEWMKKNNIPVTRENYVALNTLGDADGSDMLDAEQEAELPAELQHPDFSDVAPQTESTE